MAKFENEIYNNETLEVDGNRYERCTFNSCRLVYQGGDLPVFVGCTFVKTGLQLQDSAAQTVKYLNNLYKAGQSATVERVLEGIQYGTLARTQRPLPPPAVNTGTNFGQLGIVHAIALGVVILFVAAMYYGNLAGPAWAVVEGATEPITEQFPLDAMPALPDVLAESYDQLRTDQLTLISGYSWADEEAQVARIPIEDAFDLVLTQGLPVPAAPDTDEEAETDGDS